MRFGKQLRKARNARGWTGERLAEKSGIVAAQISHYETGRHVPNLTNLKRLCIALEVSADWMLEFKPDKLRGPQPPPISVACHSSRCEDCDGGVYRTGFEGSVRPCDHSCHTKET